VDDQNVTTWAEIAIESGTASELAVRCLVEAATGLADLAMHASAVADTFRVGESAAANRDLAAITQGIATALTITSAASLGAGIDLGSFATPASTLIDLASDTTHHLQTLIQAQQAGDWWTAADILDQGLAPILARWRTIVDSLQSAVASHSR
jgi:hypothetical protein